MDEMGHLLKVDENHWGKEKNLGNTSNMAKHLYQFPSCNSVENDNSNT